MTDTPHADAPHAEAPHADAPHAEAPHADAPHADAPDADAPDADAPDADAPDADDDLFSVQAPQASDSILRVLAMRGLTDDEIADRLGMATDDVRAHPDVLGAWSDAHDERVMRALYSAAVGGRRAKQVIVRGEIETLHEDRPPDTRAALEWLRTRRRPEWAQDAREPLRVVVVRLPSASDTVAVQRGHVIDHDPQRVDHDTSAR